MPHTGSISMAPPFVPARSQPRFEPGRLARVGVDAHPRPEPLCAPSRRDGTPGVVSESSSGVRIRTIALAVLVVVTSCTRTGAESPATREHGGPAAPRAPEAHSSMLPASPASATPFVARSPRPSLLVWASVEQDGSIVKVVVGRREVLRRFRTGGGPHNITVGPDGTVAAALYASDGLVLVRHGRLIRVRLGGRPHDVKIAGRTVVVANEGAARLDLVSLQGKRRG